MYNSCTPNDSCTSNDSCTPNDSCNFSELCVLSDPSKSSEIISTAIGEINPISDIIIINQPNCTSNNNFTMIWTTKITDVNNNIGTSVATDSDNNIVIIGFYIVDLSNNPATIYNSNNTIGNTIESSGVSDAIIVKFDSCGNLIWIAKIDGIFTDIMFGITVDANNNIIATGSYMVTTLKIYDSNDHIVLNLPLLGKKSSFVVKYDPCGNVLWANTISTDNLVISTSVKTDTDDNIVVTGFYNGSMLNFFNPDNSIGFTLPKSTTDDIFIVKYDSIGFVIWATKIGNILSSHSMLNPNNRSSIDISMDNTIVVTGFYKTNSVIIYESPDGNISPNISLTANTDCVHNSNIFIIKYTTTGHVIWATQINCMSDDSNPSVSVDGNDNIIITGKYQTYPLTVYNTPNGSITTIQSLDNNELTNAFIVKYNCAGVGIWSTRIINVTPKYNNSIATDNKNNIVITGFYMSAPLIIHSSNDIEGASLINSRSTDAFIIKYDTFGKILWVAKQSNIIPNYGSGVAIDNNNNMITTKLYDSFLCNICENRVQEDIKNMHIAKYVDFGQTITLLSSLQQVNNIKIVIDRFNKINTLIIIPCGLVQNICGTKIKGIIFTTDKSSIILDWFNNIWIVSFFEDVVFIYAMSVLLS